MLRILRFLLLAGAMLWSLFAGAQGTCGPSPLGEPCAAGGIAVAGHTEPGLNLGAGNPIHLATGNKHQKETDLPAHPQAPDIEIVRHYNAQDRRVSALGRGWALSYDTRLFHAGGAWQIVQADGSRIHYANAAGRPVANRHGALVADGQEWVWTWPDGRRLRFNAQGFLLRITARDGAALALRRSQQAGPLANMLERVESTRGGWLDFHYRVQGDQAYLRHIDTPLGRFEYQYDGGEAGPDDAPPSRLTGVKRPDGMRKHYLYEAARQSGNPYALTGIEIVAADAQTRQRISTWAYDRQGRAILAIAGKPDSLAGKVQLAYPRAPRPGQAGLTIVTSAGNQETHFRTAIRGGRYVLTRVSGAQCPGCAASGTQAEYDALGRLLAINGTRIQRGDDGHVLAIAPHAPGWPGLALRYQANGRRQSWHASLTGTESLAYNNRGLPLQRRFQNGDTLAYAYDAQGRPTRIMARRQGRQEETRLGWHGALLTRIEHPRETETRAYDSAKRLAQRHVQRDSAVPGQSLRYAESFEYDAQHRLQRHHLPEGGSLSYRWNPEGRLAAIHWRDAQGNTHTVIDSEAGKDGYRHGNGLRLRAIVNPQGQAEQLTLGNDGQAPVWTLDHYYNEDGRLQQESHHVPGQDYTETWRYAYDAQARLIGAEGTRRQGKGAAPEQDTLWYAWHDDGALAALRRNGVTHVPSLRRDASGLPTEIDGRRLAYGPQRRLTQVSRHDTESADPPAAAPQTSKVLADYQHNAFGHRIGKRSPGIRSDYFYLDNQLVAEKQHPPDANDLPSGKGSPLSADERAQPAFSVSRRYIRVGQTVVGLIVYPEAGADTGQAQLLAVHTDLVGAPRLVTDSHQRIRWLAAYEPGGRATRMAGDLTLDLRLPGQLFDPETGWHDNLLRTYLPGLGHYLEPDPLGPVPGSQALGYAAQQPRRYIDPLGLLLFAFDGTRNSSRTRSNIWKMSQAYLDGPVFYHSGPGNDQYLDWAALTASQAEQIIENQWQSLLNVLSRSGSLTEHLPIDIIGFSRGAALARHFGNLIHQHTQGNLFSYEDRQRGRITACIDLRFMGLFDTVAQFGVAGSQNANYDLTIAAAWEWVAHAVALHERRWAFPLTSAADSEGLNIIEAPFIGAHADIGGGALHLRDASAEPGGDLADVALNWMLWQARAASLRFDLADPNDREITRPILHDERPALSRSVQDGDRSVSGADGATTHYYQDSHPALGRGRRDSTEALIQRREHWRSRAGSDVGTVDMSGYALWLRDELGWQPLPA